ncbi:hypothetical protein R3P38DRAFT_3518391 [Favolaschia claudopus]|uniref:Novel STAND NTPase 1 domain-containing protein n=1 Tax=Favolaschia claudopus TaxID=2862362 RepID=A0AAW0BP81_9AGAR
MPRKLGTVALRLNSIIAGLTSILPLLKELGDAFNTPFLLAISATTASLLKGIQTIKKNKEECAGLAEDVNKILLTVATLHLKAEIPGSLSAAILHQLGKFTEILQKVHAFVNAQQEGYNIKSFLRQSDMHNLLKECRQGLQQTFETFQIEFGGSVLHDIGDLQHEAEKTHQKLLELIARFSEETSSDWMSSFYGNRNDLGLSSKSFSMLPSQPKVFHGREAELQQIVSMFDEGFPRISILGPGGIGKTSLARAALHLPDIASKFEDRIFVSCEAALTPIDIAASIAAYLDIKPGPDLTQPIVNALAAARSSLLILDNLESVWEPTSTRSSVEEFLSLLTGIPHLALIVTLRGAEHPAKVQWTRPFLPPLMPLNNDAARQTFMDITDEELEELDQLLSFTDNLPLAVDLLAHLVIYDGASSVLARWEIEKTSLLSEGYDQHSSLDASIAISLSSPRFSSVPGAMNLLQLLSILPDGLSDLELIQSNLPIEDILQSKAVLLSTSLAYRDDKRRIKSLVPIREYMQQFHPVKSNLVWNLQEYFSILLELNQRHFGTVQTAALIDQITLNLGNLYQIVSIGLTQQNEKLNDTISCLLSLNMFTRTKGYGRHALMECGMPLIHLCTPQLEVQFIIELFGSTLLSAISDAKKLVSRGESQLEKCNDPNLNSRFYSVVASFHPDITYPEAKHMMQEAMKLVNTLGSKAQTELLTNAAAFYWKTGEYFHGRELALQAINLAHSIANLYEEAKALRVKAGCSIWLSEYSSAVLDLKQARDLLTVCGLADGPLYYKIWDLEADVYFHKSQFVEAKKSYTLIAQQHRVNANPIDYAYALQGIAEADIGMDTYNDSCNLETARDLFAKHRLQSGILICEIIIAGHELKQQKSEIKGLKASLQSYLQQSWTDDPQVTFYALERMGNISSWPRSELPWAATHAFLYLAFSGLKKEKLAFHKALLYIGDMFSHNEDTMTAENLFIVALQGFTKMDVHCSRAQCLTRLGDLALAQKNELCAQAYWRTAQQLFEQSCHGENARKVFQKLTALQPIKNET